MSRETYKAVRCRSCAEELRAIAAVTRAPNDHVLLMIAESYDQIAAALEALVRSREVLEHAPWLGVRSRLPG